MEEGHSSHLVIHNNRLEETGSMYFIAQVDFYLPPQNSAPSYTQPLRSALSRWAM